MLDPNAMRKFINPATGKLNSRPRFPAEKDHIKVLGVGHPDARAFDSLYLKGARPR